MGLPPLRLSSLKHGMAIQWINSSLKYTSKCAPALRGEAVRKPTIAPALKHLRYFSMRHDNRNMLVHFTTLPLKQHPELFLARPS